MNKRFSAYSVLLTIFLIAALPATALSWECETCEFIDTFGDVYIKIDQHQEAFSGQTGDNGFHTGSSGIQMIEARGQGDHTTFVSAEGELIQFEPYHVESASPFGNTAHFGEAFMQTHAVAGTGERCQTMSIDVLHDRHSETNTSMTANTMDSSIASGASLLAHAEGAPGTTSLAAHGEQVNGYLIERQDGAWQQGMTRTVIDANSD